MTGTTRSGPRSRMYAKSSRAPGASSRRSAARVVACVARRRVARTLNDHVSTHLEHSAWSRALVEGADAVDPVLDSATQARMLARVRADIGAESRGRRWFQSWLAPALAAAVIVVVILVLRRPQPPTQTATVGVASPPATPASTPPASVRSAPAFVLPLDKPEVRFTAMALVLRGSADGPKFVDVVAWHSRVPVRRLRDGRARTGGVAAALPELGRGSFLPRSQSVVPW